jgi:hypothetical protein
MGGVTISGGITMSGAITLEEGPSKTTKAYLNVGVYNTFPIDPVNIGQQSGNGIFVFNGISATSDTSGSGPYFSNVAVGWLANGPGVTNVAVVMKGYDGPDSIYINGAYFVVGESYTFTNPN